MQLRKNQDFKSQKVCAAEEVDERRHIFMVYIVVRLIWMISWITINLRTSFEEGEYDLYVALLA